MQRVLRNPLLPILALTLGSLLFPDQARAANLQVPFKIKITKFAIDCALDGATKGQPDPYVKVSIEGTGQSPASQWKWLPDWCGKTKPPMEWKDVSASNIEFRRMVDYGTLVDVKIELWDDDDIDPDDQADLDPTTDKNINLQLYANAGKWFGDKKFPDSCMWNGWNGICWEISPDSDGDGLLDEWETKGFDSNGDGTVDVPIHLWGATVGRKDIFLELDWVVGAEPKKATIERLVKAFDFAPVGAGGSPNPDRSRGIRLHVDTGALAEGGSKVGQEELANGNAIASPPAGWCGFAEKDTSGKYQFAKVKAANFDAKRAAIFRYAVVKPAGDCDYCVGGTGGKDKATGCGQMGGPDMVMQFEAKANPTKPDRIDSDAAMLMHELGHTLGLKHGGKSTQNCKPPYISVMNYFYGGGVSTLLGKVIDYYPPLSITGWEFNRPDLRYTIAPLNEASLDETLVYDNTGSLVFQEMRFVNAKGAFSRGPLYREGIDWDGDPKTKLTSVKANIDISPTSPPELVGVFTDCNKTANNAISTVSADDDWSSLKLPFTAPWQLGGGTTQLPTGREPNMNTMRKIEDSLHTTNLSVTVWGDGGAVPAFSMFGYDVEVKDLGPNPADAPLLHVEVPFGTFFDQNWGSACSPLSDVAILCDIGRMPAGGSAVLGMEIFFDYSNLYEWQALTAQVLNDGIESDASDNYDSVPLMIYDPDEGP